MMRARKSKASSSEADCSDSVENSPEFEQSSSENLSKSKSKLSKSASNEKNVYKYCCQCDLIINFSSFRSPMLLPRDGEIFGSDLLQV